MQKSTKIILLVALIALVGLSAIFSLIRADQGGFGDWRTGTHPGSTSIGRTVGPGNLVVTNSGGAEGTHRQSRGVLISFVIEELGDDPEPYWYANGGLVANGRPAAHETGLYGFWHTSVCYVTYKELLKKVLTKAISFFVV